jgi:haloalkane dehalogenase
VIPELPASVRAIFPFEPHWAEGGGFRLHYVDEGPRTPEAVLLLHGNATWSFLYRNIIPPILAAGFRVVAPDFLGCGRSDHGTSKEEYAIVNHAGRTLATLEQAGVERAVMFLHDWGGPIGLGMAVAKPSLLAGLCLGNTFWGEASSFHRRIGNWRQLHAPVAGAVLLGRRRLFVNAVRISGPPGIDQGAVWEGYRLPFDYHGRADVTLNWPRAISLGPGHPTQPLADAIWEAMPSWNVPVRFAWGDADLVFPIEEQAEAFRRRLPRGAEHPIRIIKGARHFIQEFGPEAIAEETIAVAKEAFGR